MALSIQLARRLQESLERSVQKGALDACWPFTGHTNEKGYGRISYRADDGRVLKEYAHRVAYVLEKGEALSDDVCVLHDCDNPPCCNPEHHFEGDRAKNMRDMYRKGRANPPSGEEHFRAKLNAAQVRKIRALRKKGETQVKLAERFAVSRRAVRSILDGTHWKEG